MTKGQRIELFNRIYLKYCNQMWIHAGIKGDGFYSRIIAKEVAIEPDTFLDPSEWAIFATLHEIGHVLTNTPKMKRCTQEYLATQWALDEARKLGFAVPQQYIDTYQNYIWQWRDRSIRLKGKAVPTKEELRLA